MNSHNLRSGIFRGVWQFNLTIQPSRPQKCRIQHVRTVRGGNDLDHIIRVKSIQLTQQFQHGTLNFTITRLITPKTFGTNSIQLINKDNRTAGCTIGNFLLGKFECIPNQLGSISNKHLNQLRTSQFQKHRIGLIGTGTCQQGLTCPGRTVEKHPLGWFDTNRIKHVLMRHGQHNSLNKFLDLLISTTNIRIFLSRTFIHLHGLDTRVKFGR
mmetsp:Transcript_24175/g.37491  ORF Transcript_24175/g.37491 Transcript_24175/m.37491 type:complete len:212 (-) Transcript_24175:702-1337(-)